MRGKGSNSLRNPTLLSCCPHPLTLPRRLSLRGNGKKIEGSLGLSGLTGSAKVKSSRTLLFFAEFADLGEGVYSPWVFLGIEDVPWYPWRLSSAPDEQAVSDLGTYGFLTTLHHIYHY